MELKSRISFRFFARSTIIKEGFVDVGEGAQGQREREEVKRERKEIKCEI
jgi:hypothetical protein